VSEQTIRTIGLLDRALSELKLLALSDIDAADIQTVKHHAEDCIGLGNRVLQILESKRSSVKGETPNG
jgi:hypothetical protein